MQNLIFKGLNGKFKIAAATQYITRIKDSTKKKVSCIKVFYCFTVTVNVNLHFIFKCLCKKSYFTTEVDNHSSRFAIRHISYN